MSAFGNGTIFGTIDYGGKFVFLLSVDYSYATRSYKFESARLRLVGSDLPARKPSRADLLKIAAYLDNRFGVGVVAHRNSAAAQLAVFFAELDMLINAA